MSVVERQDRRELGQTPDVKQMSLDEAREQNGDLKRLFETTVPFLDSVPGDGGCRETGRDLRPKAPWFAYSRWANFSRS